MFPKSDPKGTHDLSVVDIYRLIVCNLAAPAESVPGTGGEREPTSVMGNPYALKGALSKLDQALSEAISSLEGEESSVGSSANENALVQKFKSWQAELLHLSRGQGGSGGQATGNPQEGPLFTD